MVRMILTDLDHTLLRQDGSISEKTLEVLAECRAKGALFAIATARYWIGAERYIELLKPDYEITTDGTLIHSREQCIYSCEFSISDTNRIIHSIGQAVPDAEITVAKGKTVYWNSRHISDSEKLHKAVYCDYSAPLKVAANKIVAELPDERIARQIADSVNCKLQCYRGEKWFAFLPKGSGKTEAIKALSKASGISLEDTIAFGDDQNDIEMLKICGKGVAVANAVPEVLEAADEITLSNDEDGVAGFIAGLFSGKGIIAACGNDCSACPRYVSHPYEKSDRELRHTAELWMKIGYRDHIVSNEEIACTGCRPGNWCRYNVVRCCRDKGIKTCAECDEYPCANMKDCFSVTKSFEPKCREVCTDKEYESLKKAFFEKEQNLKEMRENRFL